MTIITIGEYLGSTLYDKASCFKFSLLLAVGLESRGKKHQQCDLSLSGGVLRVCPIWQVCDGSISMAAT